MDGACGKASFYNERTLVTLGLAVKSGNVEMDEVDPQRCASLLQYTTDRLAAAGPRSAWNAALTELMEHVRDVSAAAGQRLKGALDELHPSIGWRSEEGGLAGPDHWLYDPIDGAYHYLQGLPLWSSSLVLVRGGRPVLSIVYDPTRREMFVASRGDGATCNGEPIAVSPKSSLDAAVLGTAIPPRAQVGKAAQKAALSLLGMISPAVFVVRPMASASLQLAYVAAGRLDAYWETGRDVADWLAGSLLVREAGGTVSDLKGEPFNWSGDGIVAANADLRRMLLALVGGAPRRGLA